MNGTTRTTSGVDLRAVGVGLLWGLGLMLLGAMGQGVISHFSPLSAGAESLMPWLWQGAGSLLGGFLAARRAEGAGWLHGSLAGLALALSLAAVMGVSSALPALALALKMAGMGTGAGVLGGVLGINTTR